MSRLEAALILFLILLTIIFLVDYLFVKRKYLNKMAKKKRKKQNELTEIAYLVNKFKLDKKKLNLNYLLITISFINAFIISLVAIVVILININILFQLIIGFILLIALIYSLYELLGQYLLKKERND